MASTPGWRISKATVEGYGGGEHTGIRQKIGKRCFVFQLVDNSYHMALSNECVHLPNFKGADSKYHIYGETVLFLRDTQYEMLRTCIPLLNLAEGKCTNMLGPLPRYLYSRCWDDMEHVRGLESARHSRAMQEAVEKARVDLKDFLRTRGLRSFRTINLGKAIESANVLKDEED